MFLGLTHSKTKLTLNYATPSLVSKCQYQIG